MPFTPFHMGPGLLIKALLQSSFSLMVFGWTQIAMDVQPLIAMIGGMARLHGFTHTYLGATLIAIAAAVTGKYLSQWALVEIFGVTPLVIRWWVALLSAFIGAYSHVALDSLMHADMRPLWPFANTNAMLGLVSVSALHRFCVYSALVGAVAYITINRLIARKHRRQLAP